jgi:RNA methyltransferase, TrmH family
MLALETYFRFIQSANNDVVKNLKIHLEGGAKANKLRKDSGLTCIEGIHLIKAWVDANKVSDLDCIVTSISGLQNKEIHQTLTQLIQYCEGNDLSFPDFIIVEDTLANHLSSLMSGPFLAAMLQIPEEIGIQDCNDNILILDGIQDSGNVGTILRTALAAGYRNILCTKGTAHIWSIKVLRAAMGAHIVLKFFEGLTPEECTSHIKLPLFITALDSSAVSLYGLGQKLLQQHAFVFGNEGSGVNPHFFPFGEKIYIPQDTGIESLNVAAAAAVCLFEARRVLHHQT